MSSGQNISNKKSFTHKNSIYTKEKKHYSNEVDNRQNQQIKNKNQKHY